MQHYGNESGGQSGLSLMEIAFALVIFAAVITSALYGIQAVRNAKLKAFVIQLTHIRDASETFRKQYGTLPGDFGFATARLKGCGTSDINCFNGNGDEIVASSTSNGACQMPDYDGGDQAFPCPNLGNGNETAQFWRHLVLAGMLDGISLRRPVYRWGDGLPRVRQGGGFQISFNSNTNNLYLRDFNTNVSPTGHYLSYQRLPNLFHRSFGSTGDGAISGIDAWRIDQLIDDGRPLTGSMRSTGGWGCGNVGTPSTDDVYNELDQMQCLLLIRLDP